MAVTNSTNFRRQEEIAKNTQQPQSSTPYNGMQGVSKNTAANLGNYQQGYKQSDAVNTAQQNLQNVQAQKPQGYTSKYQPALDNIMQQIQNPKEFKYEFNGDNLFKNYADLYTQKAKQASIDTMGQAAALTGGYGNSYAQNVAAQAYQQNLLPLYDKGMELSQMAYQRYQDDLGNLKDQYNMLQGADATDYGRYRDTVGDWQNEEAQAYNRMLQERDFDYGDYQNALDYYTGLAQVENAAYNNDAERQEAIRQYEQNYNRSVLESDRAYDRDVLESDRNFAENQRQYDTDNQYRYDTLGWQQATDQRDFDESVRQANQKTAMSYVNAILANGQMPSMELLQAAGLSLEDAQKLMAQLASGGGGYGGNGGDTEKDVQYFDDGTLRKWVTSTGKDGKSTGKWVEVDPSKVLASDIKYDIYDNSQNPNSYTNMLSSMLAKGVDNAPAPKVNAPGIIQTVTTTDNNKNKNKGNEGLQIVDYDSDEFLKWNKKGG